MLDVKVGIGGLIPLLDEQPILLRSGANQGITTAQPHAVQPEFHLAAAQRLGRGRLLEVIGSPIPDHHRPAAVLTLGDGALEVVVAHGMVFDVRRQPALGGIQRGPFGDRPADEHTLHFEAEVVVQPGCPMLLHSEAVSSAGVGCTLRFGSLAEIAFSLVLRERTWHRIQFDRMV